MNSLAGTSANEDQGCNTDPSERGVRKVGFEADSISMPGAFKKGFERQGSVDTTASTDIDNSKEVWSRQCSSISQGSDHSQMPAFDNQDVPGMFSNGLPLDAFSPALLPVYAGLGIYVAVDAVKRLVSEDEDSKFIVVSPGCADVGENNDTNAVAGTKAYGGNSDTHERGARKVGFERDSLISVPEHSSLSHGSDHTEMPAFDDQDVPGLFSNGLPWEAFSPAMIPLYLGLATYVAVDAAKRLVSEDEDSEGLEAVW